MAEEKQVKSRRDIFGERLKKKYPDREYADDEALFGQIDDDYDEYENQLSGYRESETKLTDMFSKDPRSAQFIADMAQGKDPWTSLINRIGIDGVKEMLDDPAKMEEFAKSNKEYVERMAKQKGLEDEWEKNMKVTLSMLEQKQQELGLSDEQIDAAADWIKEVTNDAVIGIIRPETIDMALKAINHDADIAAASEEAEIRGKNAKAEAQLRKSKRGDGTPTLAGANNAPAPVRQKDSIFDIADGAR
ncbi:MAG: hypothetical protein K2L55_01735 [Muribaculaceae bacterium]|nr:hypothetical protein [Muribaculaceae bacterium]